MQEIINDLIEGIGLNSTQDTDEITKRMLRSCKYSINEFKTLSTIVVDDDEGRTTITMPRTGSEVMPDNAPDNFRKWRDLHANQEKTRNAKVLFDCITSGNDPDTLAILKDMLENRLSSDN